MPLAVLEDRLKADTGLAEVEVARLTELTRSEKLHKGKEVLANTTALLRQVHEIASVERAVVDLKSTIMAHCRRSYFFK